MKTSEVWGADAPGSPGRVRKQVGNVILEGIVTTISPEGELNVAPMGPHVPDLLDEPFPDPLRRFALKPFKTSRTYQNLAARGEGVLHVTDDVLLLAQAAVGTPDPSPPTFPAARVRGLVLRDACRYAEFRIAFRDDRAERVILEAEVLHTARLRDFFGFNRAKHAVVEAAILATRTHFLSLAEVEAEYARLAVLVDKTGGPREREAFEFLRRHLDRVRQRRSDEGRE